jgi:hypothetical protein
MHGPSWGIDRMLVSLDRFIDGLKKPNKSGSPRYHHKGHSRSDPTVSRAGDSQHSGAGSESAQPDMREAR